MGNRSDKDSGTAQEVNLDNSAADQSNQFQAMMAQQQRARMQQIQQRQQRQQFMGGGMPQGLMDFRNQITPDFMGLLAQLGQQYGQQQRPTWGGGTDGMGGGN